MSMSSVSSPLWSPDKQGFVCHWMVSGPALSEIEGDVGPGDQFKVEARLREAVVLRARLPFAPPMPGAVDSRLGLPWRFAGGRDGAFVNLSDFYASLCRVRFDAATVLIAPRAMRLKAALWSYAAVDVWLNGARVGGIDAPCYKPMRRLALTLELREGPNALYLACETLGARDTRSVVGLQLLDREAGIRVALPDGGCAQAVWNALAFLEGVEPRAERLRFPSPAPEGTTIAWEGGFEPDYAKAVVPPPRTDVSGLWEAALDPGECWVTIRVPAARGGLRRRIEITEHVRPRCLRPVPSYEDNLRGILERVAAVESLNRGGEFGFAISNILARRALGFSGKRDKELMWETLSLIERRVDCADFLVCGLIRYARSYPVDTALGAGIERALTGFRSWMDMEGSDGMCFWSENHALMFYSCAMFAGEMYPGARFPRAGMSGVQLRAWGRERVLEWLEDVEKWGFEEFLSGVYMCLTFIALLNLIDFAEADIARRAEALADRLLAQLALHTWRGGFIAPMGRVYRSVLYPFAQGVMSLINLIDPSQPYDFGEGWLGFYANSRYRLPEGLKARIDAPVSANYTTGNARVVLEKRADWCLTSVQIPREPFARWRADGPGAAFQARVKAQNEGFHGTTDFHPGRAGYQQHLWYAALDGEAILFANHPGAASEEGDMRPGYWHGNGVFPALKQRGGLLGMIYRIPEAQPLHYIHLYAPECRFDGFEAEGCWLFARKQAGFIGFWSSAPSAPFNGVNFHCERRVYGDEIAALCVCGGREFADMDHFMAHCRALAPEYRPREGLLRAGDFQMTYGEETA